MIVWVINGLALVLIAWLVWRKDHSPLKSVYWLALLLKVSAGIILGMVYTYAYIDSDTVLFFESSRELSDLAKKDFPAYINYLWSATDAPYSGENRTLFFVKLVSILALPAGGNYWLVSIYFSVVSFFAARQLALVIVRWYPGMTTAATLAFLIIPSSVFWSAGVIKESAAVSALFILSSVFLCLWAGQRINLLQFLYVFITLWIAWSLKYYYAAVFLAIAGTAFLTRWFVNHRMRHASKTTYRIFVLYSVLMLVMIFIVTFVHPNFYPQRLLEVVVENNKVFVEASHPDKVIHYFQLEPTFGSLLVNAPWALISGLFRPFIWEVSNAFQLLVSIENLFIFGLSIASIRLLKKRVNSDTRILQMALIYYCVILCVFLALSAPNFGTLVRYRVGFMPYFLLLVCANPWITKQLSFFVNPRTL